MGDRCARTGVGNGDRRTRPSHDTVGAVDAWSERRQTPKRPVQRDHGARPGGHAVDATYRGQGHETERIDGESPTHGSPWRRRRGAATRRSSTRCAGLRPSSDDSFAKTRISVWNLSFPTESRTTARSRETGRTRVPLMLATVLSRTRITALSSDTRWPSASRNLSDSSRSGSPKMKSFVMSAMTNWLAGTKGVRSSQGRRA